MFGKKGKKTEENCISFEDLDFGEIPPQSFDTGAMDHKLKEDAKNAEVESDIEYRKIAKSIADISNDQLGKQNKSKIDLKDEQVRKKWTIEKRALLM